MGQIMCRLNLCHLRTSLLGLLASFTVSVFAQNYPDKSVRLIVPFPPGGATDVVARALSAKLSPIWKQQLIVENKPGAGGNIGADLVAKSSPDGYTYFCPLQPKWPSIHRSTARCLMTLARISFQSPKSPLHRLYW